MNLNQNLAISAMKDHQISLSFLRFHIQNNFYLPKPIVDDCLETHILLYWDPYHYFTHMKEGKLNLYGDDYQVIYHNCTPEKVRCSSQIRLSIRKCKPHCDIGNYVLVTPKG